MFKSNKIQSNHHSNLHVDGGLIFTEEWKKENNKAMEVVWRLKETRN